MSRLGQTTSPEHRAKLSAALKGRPKSPETKAKLSVAMKRRLAEGWRPTRSRSGDGCGRYTRSDETRAKMSEIAKKRWAEAKARGSNHL